MIPLLALLVCLAQAGAPPSDERPVATFRTAAGPAVITLGRLQAYAAKRPGVPAAQLVRELVDFELLAAEAEKAAVAGPEVREAAAPVAVAHLLARDFEPRYRASDIPPRLLREAWDQNYFYFNSPPLRRSDHLLLGTVGDRPQRPGDPALDAAAQAFMAGIRAEIDAHPPADAEAFRDLAARFAPEVPAGLAIRAEALGLTPEASNFAQEFREALFRLPGPGSYSEPISTTFGWHIIRLDEVVPEKKTTFEAQESVLREKVLVDFRRRALLAWTNTLGATVPVVVNFAPIAAAAERGISAPPP